MLGLVWFGTFLISGGGTYLLIGWLSHRGVLDIPNLRSSHKRPTPRGGGVAIIASFLIGALLTYFLNGHSTLPGWGFFTGLVLVGLAGWLDDKHNLPVAVRFLLYGIAGGMVFWETGGFEQFPLPEPFSFHLSWLSLPVTLFWVIAVVNIYNFLDGIDGYAGLQAILASGGMMLLDFEGTGFFTGILLLSASIGFLLFNWHPARIFMGDIGSATLGFIFATVPFYFTQVSSANGIFSMGIFLWFFLSDGAFTIIRRLLKGEKVWEAHRSHLYQQLSDLFSHARVSAGVMMAAATLVGLYFYMYYQPDYNLIWILPVAILFFLAYYYFVSRLKKRKHVPRQETA